MVIVAVPSFGEGGLNTIMNPRFGRCESFTFITVEDNQIIEVKTALNNAAEAMGGAGVQAAQLVGNYHATEIIVGFLGPNAAQALSALNLKMYQVPNPNQQMTVKEAIEMYMAGKLSLITNANVNPHFGMGMGGGGGMGGGRGMGRGGGMGQGRGMGNRGPPF